tara:strand:- start:952 stop:1272 length:321 start_codon:yes stop_codon:yes gene_type:complete
MNTQDKNLHTDQKNKKYTFAQREGDDFSCIKLTEGKYKDVVYHYGKVGFAKEENKDGTLPMKFDYTIKQNPNNLDLNENVDFLNYIGDILIEILEQQLKDGTAVIS